MFSLPLKKVLITDQVHESCDRLLESHGVAVSRRIGLTKPQLVQAIKDYDGLIVRSETKVDSEVLDAGLRLKVVGRAGSGVDNIDTAAASARGILVLNTPGGNSISACELTCALILSIARKVTGACRSLKEGKWQRKEWTGREVKGKVLAVIGLGRVGREVALRMSAFSMTILGYDPYPPPGHLLPTSVRLASLQEIWETADYITLHVPLLPQTKGLVNKEVLEKCKDGVGIVNCARGGIVDEVALLEAVETGRACAGLDVFSSEPPNTEVLQRLIQHPAVVVTPHLGASTAEAQERVAVEIAEQFVGLAQPASGYHLEGVVNCPGLRELLEAEGVIYLGRGLGVVAKALEVGVGARYLLQGPRHLAAPVLLGLMGGGGSNGLNLISAPALAAKAGLTLEVEHVPGPEVCLQITSSSAKYLIKGTVKDGQSLLLCINDATFMPAARLSNNTFIYRTVNVNNDLLALMGKVMGQGALISSISMAQGKLNSWIVAETTRSPVHLNLIEEEVH